MKWSLILFASVLAGEDDIPGSLARAIATPPVRHKSLCQRKRPLHRQAAENLILLPKEIFKEDDHLSPEIKDVDKSPILETKEMVINDISSQPLTVPIHIEISDAELNPYRELADKVIKSGTIIKTKCDFIDNIEQKPPTDVFKTYSDISVVQETKNTTYWECELAEAPSDRLFHTDINRCHPSLEGQCTEWADGRYYQLTGFHGFSANAVNWTYVAYLTGEWNVFDQPVYPSIAVKASSDSSYSHGHVSIVESIASDGKLCTSHWNSPFQKKLNTYLRSPMYGIKYLAHKKANYSYIRK